MSSLTIQSFMNLSTAPLAPVADRPVHELRILIAHVVQKTPEWVFAHPEWTLTSEQVQELEAFVARRLKEEPLAKILERKDFWKDTFVTNAHTLDPRPESELIIEAALARYSTPPERILELGVGTGCLILSLLGEFSTARGVGVDLSYEALQVAAQNAENLGRSQRVNWVQSSWFGGLNGEKPSFDLIVANPPYIPSGHVAYLSTTVQEYDPEMSLDGGDDGLGPYRHFAQHHIDRYVKPGGYLIMEMGAGQEKTIIDLFKDRPFVHEETLADLQSIARVLVLKRV